MDIITNAWEHYWVQFLTALVLAGLTLLRNEVARWLTFCFSRISVYGDWDTTLNKGSGDAPHESVRLRQFVHHVAEQRFAMKQVFMAPVPTSGADGYQISPTPLAMGVGRARWPGSPAYRWLPLTAGCAVGPRPAPAVPGGRHRGQACIIAFCCPCGQNTRSERERKV